MEKNAIEASQRAQRTSKATLNPMVSFFLLVLLISEKENKQGLDAIDASVSKRVCLHCGDEGQ